MVIQEALKIPEDKLEIRQDSFRGSKIASLEMHLHSKEEIDFGRTAIPASRITVIFWKEIIGNRKLP